MRRIDEIVARGHQYLDVYYGGRRRDNVSAPRKSRPSVPMYSNGNSRKSGHAVVCMYDDGKEKRYPTMTAAADAEGCSVSGISSALAGRIGTCGGRRWRFANTESPSAKWKPKGRAHTRVVYEVRGADGRVIRYEGRQAVADGIGLSRNMVDYYIWKKRPLRDGTMIVAVGRVAVEEGGA